MIWFLLVGFSADVELSSTSKMSVPPDIQAMVGFFFMVLTNASTGARKGIVTHEIQMFSSDRFGKTHSSSNFANINSQAPEIEAYGDIQFCVHFLWSSHCEPVIGLTTRPINQWIS